MAERRGAWGVGRGPWAVSRGHRDDSVRHSIAWHSMAWHGMARNDGIVNVYIE